MSIIHVVSRFAGISFIVLAGVARAAAAPELTLDEAGRLAIERAPWLQRYQADLLAAGERVTYSDRLPDPQLTFGLSNVPTDTYRLNQEDMTMVNVGLRQAFPPGDTLKLRGQRAEREFSGEQARFKMERRRLLQQVRETWLELYFLEQSRRLLAEQQPLARRQYQAAEGRYRAAVGNPQEMLRAREDMARLDERDQDLRAQAERQRATLARWIGDAAYAPLPETLPSLPAVPNDFDPRRNPEWLTAEADLEAARLGVEIARQNYKPGMMLDLSYGARQARPDGQSRPDFASAMVTFDLPIFRSKRQDPQLAEKQKIEAATEYEAEDRQRELEARYRAARAEHDALAARVHVFETELLPALRRQTQITITGFARDQAPLREARLKVLDANMQLLRLRTDYAKSQAELLYLTGENNP